MCLTIFYQKNIWRKWLILGQEVKIRTWKNRTLITHGLLEQNASRPEAYISETMLGRLSNPQDFADFVVYLSRKNNISEQIFNLDSRVLF